MPSFLGLGPDNPIAWSNFYRKGGFRTILMASGAYFGILATLIFLSGRLSERDAARAYGAWTSGLLGLQVLFMVIIGAGRVSATIRGDLNSGMAESLRMMPLSGGHAVAGYLGAVAAQMSGFFAANFLLGLIVTGLSQMPAPRWVGANLILMAFAAFVWTVAAFSAFQVRTAGGVIAVGSLVGVFGHVLVLTAAPGLIVLIGPLIGGSVFNPRTAQTELAAPLVMSFAAQFLVGGIFFAGAARKYRRPDALALGAWLALALLLTFVGISLLALRLPELFRPTYLAREFRRVELAVPFCGSTIVAMLVALTPLANFARLHVAWAKGRAADDPDRRRTVPPPLAAGLIVAGALALMLVVTPEPLGGLRTACFLAALFGFCVSAMFVAAWFYRSVDTAKVILTIWVVAYCVVPLAVDLTRKGLSNRFDEPVLATAATFSPVGMIIESITEPPEGVDLRPAAAFHALIPLLPAGLYARVARRHVRVNPTSTRSSS